MEIRQIYEEFVSSLEEKEILLEEIREELNRFEGKIVLYGAGSAGIAFYNYLKDAGIAVCCFSDGDSEKWDRECMGIKIIPPGEIVKQWGEQALVIVTINTDGSSYCKDFKQALLKNGHQGVHRMLREAGCKNIIDYTYFRRCYALFRKERYNLPACNDVYLMKENWEKIVQVYDWLCDDSSRETFRKILQFRMLDDTVEIPVYPEKDMYFEYDLFAKRKDEVFVDCGACTGSSLRAFLDCYGDGFQKCVSLEPDKHNFAGLEEFIASLNESIRAKIYAVPGGAYSHGGYENFFQLSGPGTFAAEDGTDSLKVVRIDDVLDGKPATYIKMNIEGSEVAALQGAEYTIRTFFPRLAIMGYHKTSDLWEVPFLFKKYHPSYKLYLRSYMHNIAFAYYAC